MDMLNIKPIPSSDHSLLRNLIEEAFPEEERLPFDYYVDNPSSGIRCVGAYADTRLRGFLFYLVSPRHVYLSYFAFFKEDRGKGYGTESLGYLKSLYPDRCICIDREPLDPNAPDNVIRVKRRSFYMNSGLVDRESYQLQNGVIYQTMAAGEFHFEDLKDLLEGISHRDDPRYWAYYFRTIQEAEAFKKEWLKTIKKRYLEWLENQG